MLVHQYRASTSSDSLAPDHTSPTYGVIPSFRQCRSHAQARRTHGIRRADARRKAKVIADSVANSFIGPTLRGSTRKRKSGDVQPSKSKASGLNGTQRLKSSMRQDRSDPSNSSMRSTRLQRKDEKTVFVAGATGRLGIRIVRQILLSGFKVRAGARNVEKAQQYTDLALNLGILPADAAKRLQIVPVDFEDIGTIAAAIGNSSKVVQAIGAAEDNFLDIGAPKRVDGDAAINLVNAATEAEIKQYIMVTSLGTGKFGWPAGALNLFGGILFQKRRAEAALEQSGLQYVIVRPGGLERPGDDHKLTHNAKLETRDMLFGGTISRLQIAELIATAVVNPTLAENKVLEAVALKESQKLSYKELLRQNPSEISQEERSRQTASRAEQMSKIGDLQDELNIARKARQDANQIVDELENTLSSKRKTVQQNESESAPVLEGSQSAALKLKDLRKGVDVASRGEEAAKAVLSSARAAEKKGRTLADDEIQIIEEKLFSSGKQPEASSQASKKTPTKASYKQQNRLAEAISKQEISLKLGKAGPPPSKAETRLAEEIPKQEIALKLRRSSGRSTKSERQLADGIVQKETEISKNKDVPLTASYAKNKLGFRKSKSAGTSQAGSRTPPASSRTPPTRSPQTTKQAEQQAAAQLQGRVARAKREADFLARLDAERKEEAKIKAEKADSRAMQAIQESATAWKALQQKQERDKEMQARKRTTKNINPPSSTALLPEPKQVSTSLEDSEQDNSNVREARKWIEAWRRSQGGNGVADSGVQQPSDVAAEPKK